MLPSVSSLDAALPCGVPKFAPALLEGEVMKEELAQFDRHVSAAGRATYQARANQHDDLVLSVALGAWWASRKKFRLQVGGIRGFN